MKVFFDGNEIELTDAKMTSTPIFSDNGTYLGTQVEIVGIMFDKPVEISPIRVPVLNKEDYSVSWEDLATKIIQSMGIPKNLLDPD